MRALKWLKAPFISADAALLLGVCSAGIAVLAEASLRTSLNDAETAKECRYPPASDLLTAAHVRELERGNLVVLRNVLPASVLAAARAEACSLHHAGVMSSENHGNADDVRQDRICWIREDDTEAHCDGMVHCLKLLRGIPFLLTRHDYSRSHSFVVPRQCQLSLYPSSAGAGYARHLDRCTLDILHMGLLGWLRARDYRRRTVTAILYLNDADWTSGGHLRCFEKEGLKMDDTPAAPSPDDGAYQDVNPVGGTLIIFDSSRVEHQVMPSSSDRYALTCWINGDIQQ